MRVLALGRRKVAACAVCLLCALLIGSSSAAVSERTWSPRKSQRASQAGLTCRDADGAAVDWWLILKAPNGTRYGYIDAVTVSSEPAIADQRPDEDQSRAVAANRSAAEGHSAIPDGGWRAAGHLNSIRSPLSRTLLPLYPAANLTGCARYETGWPLFTRYRRGAHMVLHR